MLLDAVQALLRINPLIGPASMNNKPLNILCLDGGGVRGLSSLLILRDLMEQVKCTSGLPEVPLPCDVFDLICGTSTGGLIALMLGRLRMSVEDAIIHYLDFSKTVFAEKKSILSFHELWRRVSPGPDPGDTFKYDASRLKNWVIELVSKHEHTHDGQASLQDPLGEDHCCRTFVLAVTKAYADAPPKRFRSYPTMSQAADTCTIWEAVRATTAAIPFFEAATFGVPVPQTYIDGSFSGSNNPSLRAIEEVAEVFPSRKITCFLSLGTGDARVISAAGGHDEVAEACVKLINSCKRTHDEVGRSFGRKRVDADGDPYFRFSVDMGLEDIELDEWDREEQLTSITGGYMRYYEQTEKAKKFLGALTARVSEIKARQESETSLL